MASKHSRENREDPDEHRRKKTVTDVSVEGTVYLVLWYIILFFMKKFMWKIYVWCKAKAIEKLLWQNMQIISKVKSIIEIQKEIENRILNIEKVFEKNKDNKDAFIKAIKIYHEHQCFWMLLYT
jgi:hypothetical protein